MKTKPTVSLLLLPCAALLSLSPPAFADTPDATAESAIAPKAYPLSRYDPLDKKSPFEFEPPKEEQVLAADPFEGVSLAGYCGSGNTMTVYLISGAKEKKRITVFGDGSPYKKRDDSGFRVIGINRGKTLKTTSVILEKGGLQGKVEFEDETLRPKGGGPAGQPQNVQLVPGPDGKMTPRPVIPRPGGANQPQQPYQAPQAFIPGQGNQAHPQQPAQNTIINPGLLPGTLSNQQLVNQLVGPNAGQQVNPAVVQPQNAGGGEQPRPSIPPSRRRVVLPTTGQ